MKLILLILIIELLGFFAKSRQPARGEGEPVFDVRHSVGSQVERRGRQPR